MRGKSVASAQATALAKAYAAAYATAQTCHKCSAASEIIVESYEEVFLKATSEVHLELEGVANGTEVTSASAAYTRSFVNKTVTAFAEVSQCCPRTCYASQHSGSGANRMCLGHGCVGYISAY